MTDEDTGATDENADAAGPGWTDAADAAGPPPDDAADETLGDETLGDVSMAVATAETRTEMAGIALSDARDAVEPVSDLDAVSARLDAYGARLSSIEDRLAELGSGLEALVEREGTSDSGEKEAEGTTDRRRLAADAAAVQRDADELAADLDSFERWVADPETRYRELEADADAVESALAELATAVEEVATSERAAGSNADGSEWIEMRLRHRVAKLLLTDVRAELVDLRIWDDREGHDRDGLATELGDRLDDFDARAAELDDRLADLSRPAWTDRFGDRLAAFETETADLEPPLDWSAVESAFDECRPAVEREA